MDYSKIADNWTNDMNVMTFNEKELCKAMSHQHRTLQQNFTRVCIEWLRTCAGDDYGYDGRNEASHTVAKSLLDGKSVDGLPYI